MEKRTQLKRLRRQANFTVQDSQLADTKKFDRRLKIIIAFLFIVVLMLGVILRLININVIGRSPDEGIYTYQAKTIVEIGMTGVKKLVEEYNINRDAWIYPPPTRIGYSYLVASFMKITNIMDARAGTYVSVIFSIFTLLMLILIGMRFYNLWITLCALLFISVSPMDIAIARRSWQDGIFAFFGLVLIYLCCEITINPKRKIWYIPLWICGSYSLLIKESGIVIYGLCTIWLLWTMLFKERSIAKALLLIVVSFLGICASLFILAKAVGGILNVIELLRHVKEAMPTNRYAIEYQTGPWYNILLGFFILSPISTVLSFLGIVCVFFDKFLFKEIIFTTLKYHSVLKGIAFFIISFTSIAIATPYCQNLRYVSVIYVPFYLMSGLGFWYIVFYIRSISKGFIFYVGMVIIILVVIVASISDYRRFERVFIKAGIRDISIRLLEENS